MEKTAEKSTRIKSIDRMKGFIIFCMVFFIAAGEFECLGPLARISNDGPAPIQLLPGVTLGDMEAPVFLFLLSLTYQLSFDRRYQKSGKKAYLHFLGRYLIFMGLGSIMVSFENVFLDHTPDPLLIQTVLMFVLFAAAAALGILSLIKKKSAGENLGKALRAAKAVSVGSLVAMAVIDIILMTRDDIVILRGGGYGDVLMHWSILHMIGLTGLLVIPFLRLRCRGKIIAWTALTACYTFIQMLPGMVDKFDVIFLGGGMGCFGWLILMLGGMILIDLYNSDKGRAGFYTGWAFLVPLTFVTCRYLPSGSRAVTVNFIFLALLIAATLFFLVNLLNNREFRRPFFIWWGRNPLLLFFCGLLLKVPLLLWDPAPETPLWAAVLTVGGGVAVLTLIAGWCYKKNVIVKL